MEIDAPETVLPAELLKLDVFSTMAPLAVIFELLFIGPEEFKVIDAALRLQPI
jgi:hypothetical protein